MAYAMNKLTTLKSYIEMNLELWKKEKAERENQLRYEVKELAKWIEDMITADQMDDIRRVTAKIDSLRQEIERFDSMIKTQEKFSELVD